MPRTVENNGNEIFDRWWNAWRSRVLQGNDEMGCTRKSLSVGQPQTASQRSTRVLDKRLFKQACLCVGTFFLAHVLSAQEALIPATIEGEVIPENVIKDIDPNSTRYQSRRQTDLRQLLQSTNSIELPSRSEHQSAKEDSDRLKQSLYRYQSVEAKLNLQQLLQHVPVARDTIDFFSKQTEVHPQITRVVQFVSKHVDPDF